MSSKSVNEAAKAKQAISAKLIESRIGKMHGRTCIYETDDFFGLPMVFVPSGGHELCPFAETCLLLAPDAEVLCEVSDAEAEIDWAAATIRKGRYTDGVRETFWERLWSDEK